MDFLKRCKLFGIIPNSFLVFNRNPHQGKWSDKIMKNAAFKMITQTISYLRKQLDKIDEKLYRIWIEIVWTNSPIQVDVGLRKIENRKLTAVSKAKVKFQRKLEFLAKKQDIVLPKTSKKPHIINLTNREVPVELELLMSFGNKYIPPNKLKPEDAIIEAESIIRNIPQDKQEIARAELATSIVNYKRREKLGPANRDRMIINNNIKSVRNFLNVNNNFLCKSDKTQDIVLLSQDQFLTKSETCLNDLNLKKGRRTNFNKWKKEFILLSKDQDLINILGNFSPPPDTDIPKLFFNVKTHKPNFPFRPLVSARSSPSYKFERNFAKLLYPSISGYKHKAQSSIDFVKKLKCTDTPQAVQNIVLLDIQKMYSNIPPLEAHMTAINIIKNSLQLDNDIVLKFYHAFKIIRENYCFSHKDEIYVQQFGLPMGSPASAALAEVFIQSVEKEIILNPEIHVMPSFYQRYVDDIFLIWNDPITILEQKLQIVTTKHPSIKFIINKNSEYPIKYLDVAISVVDNKWKFGVSEKVDTQLIPIDAYTSFNYKKAGITSHIYRAIRLCSDLDEFSKEVKRIVNVSADFGYKKLTIMNIIKECCQKEKERIEQKIFELRSNIHVIPEPSPTYKTSISFSPIASQQKKIARRYGVNIAIKSNRNIINTVRKDSHVRNQSTGSGVYEIPLKAPNAPTRKYVGSTTRPLDSRIMEHKRGVFLTRNNIPHNITSLTDFLSSNSQYSPSWEEVRLLRHKGKDSERDLRLREAIIMRKTENIVNTDMPNINAIWNTLIDL